MPEPIRAAALRSKLTHYLLERREIEALRDTAMSWLFANSRAYASISLPARTGPHVGRARLRSLSVAASACVSAVMRPRPRSRARRAFLSRLVRGGCYRTAVTSISPVRSRSGRRGHLARDREMGVSTLARPITGTVGWLRVWRATHEVLDGDSACEIIDAGRAAARDADGRQGNWQRRSRERSAHRAQHHSCRTGRPRAALRRARRGPGSRRTSA